MSEKPPRPLHNGQEADVTIDTLAFGGEGVARLNGFAVFVPGALPGEKVTVTAREVKDRWARAELKAVLTPSPDRVAPPCPIFNECGGCQWQHLDYPRQLAAKRQAVVESLERIGRLTGLQVEPCLPSPQSFGYRNKALPVVSMRGGHFTAGIYEPRSHRLSPYNTCPIQTETINRVIQKALWKAEQAGLTPYQPKSHTGFIRHLVVRHGLGTGEILLAFVTREAEPGDRLTRPTVMPEDSEKVLPRIASELMAEVPGLVGVLQNVNSARTNIVLGPETRVLAGGTHFHESFDGLTLRVSLHSFLQVNTGQAAILHEMVREALGPGPEGKKWGTVLDLYGGIGTLALAVAGMADYVLGVEEVGPAVEDARENARLNHRRNLDFIQGDASATLVDLKARGLVQVDAALLDPPRKGVPPELLSRLAALHPERLVYVSCDPATLARDLALLVQHGYRVDWVQPLDMFPQTYHVECVARLTRTAPLATEVAPGHAAKNTFRLPPEGLSPRPAPAAPAPSAEGILPWIRGRFSSFFPSGREGPAQETPAVPSPPFPPARPRFFPRFGNSLRVAMAVLLFGGAGYAVWATFHPGLGNGAWSLHLTADLIPELPNGAVKRFDLLTFAVRKGREDPADLGPWSALAEVYKDGKLVETAGGQTVLHLKADATGRRLVGHWPVPFNPPAGTYQVRMSVFRDRLKKADSFESDFTIAPLAPLLMPPGFTALTFEGGSRITGGRIPALDGEGPESFRNVVEWTKFLGADALMFLGAQTSVWKDSGLGKDFPFNRYILETADRYGKALHEAGLKFGVYMTTFRVVGDLWSAAPYHFALGYNNAEDKLEPIEFVSMNDPTRQDQIVGLLKRLQGDDAVDFIGFDYIRTGGGGYELASEFVRDMDVETPPEFPTWSEDDRALWLARRVERGHDSALLHRFEWYRAHRVALVLKDMLERARVTKPVFTFTLGWEMGHQHGQDPAMFVDAGVGINNIMLYQRGPEQVREMEHHWPPYLDRGNSMYVLGEMVDFNWVQKSLQPPGPEELYDREVSTFETWFPHNASLGMYWHDLYRLLHGAKGPYSTMEWAVAGGKAFTFLRQAEGITPILTRLEAPREVPAGMPFNFSVEILNRSDQDLKGLTLVQLDPTLDTYSESARVGPFNLPAGHLTRVMNLRAVAPKDPHPERDNRWMLAVVVGKPGNRQVRAFDFSYLKVLTPEEAKKRLDFVKAFQASSEAAADATPTVTRPKPDPQLIPPKGSAVTSRVGLKESFQNRLNSGTTETTGKDWMVESGKTK